MGCGGIVYKDHDGYIFYLRPFYAGSELNLEVMRSAVESPQKHFECCFTSTETVGLLGTGAQDGHLDFHTSPELCTKKHIDIIGFNVRIPSSFILTVEFTP